MPWKTDQSVLASPLRSWSLGDAITRAAQGRKAAPAGGPIGTKSGGSITPKSGGPIPTKSGGSNHSKSCNQYIGDQRTSNPTRGAVNHCLKSGAVQMKRNS